MGARPKKKARLAGKNAPAEPLGSRPDLDDDTAKDDEELLLESQLFGKAFRPKGDGFIIDIEGDDIDLSAANDGGNDLFQVPDDDLFVLDAGPGPEIPFDFEDDNDAKSSEDNNSEDDSESKDDESSHEAAGAADAGPSSAKPTKALGGTKQRKSAWMDPDDAQIKISLANSQSRLRKLRDAPSEDIVNGTAYESKLRREFEKLNAPPKWAADARGKRRRAAAGDEDEDPPLAKLFSSTSGIIDEEQHPSRLQKGVLGVERLRDANQHARTEGEVKAMSFHPFPKVPVMLVAGSDRRVRLFNVDGHANTLLQTVHIPELPITNAVFHPNGSSILLTGPRPFYYTYDLDSGTATRSPRGLWGTTFTNSNPSKQSDLSMEINAFDPSGDLLAIAGRQGYIHLLDWRSGGGQVVESLKMNSPVKSLCWSQSGGRPLLSTLGQDAEVYVWDIGERRCIRRWKDDGGFGSGIIASDHSAQYVSVGSKTGIVNVYDSNSTTALDAPPAPKPLKVLGNLTTAISSIRYNRDSQLMAVASYAKKDQLRLFHLPSMTAFSNWPTSGTPLGHVSAVDFSPNSEYMAVGNNRGRVLLYHLTHFREQNP